MATVRELVTKWGFKVDDRPLKRIDARIAQVKGSLRSLASLSTKVSFGFGALSFGIGKLLKEAGDFEQIEIAFETLTQSQEKAKKLTGELIDFAQRTPFQLKGVFDSTKQLLAYGVESENMIKTLTALGNIAAGVGKEKLPQLTLAFGQVRTAGKLRGQEVRQFTEAGVPIIEAIAKQMGVAQESVQDLVSKGAVSFDMVDKALQDLANGSGRFTGLMEKQSRTLLGLWSNMQDALQVLAMTIGGTLVPEAKEYLKIAVNWLQVNKQLIQQNVSKAIKAIVNGMKQMVKLGIAIGTVLKAVINSLGGFENAVKLASFALTAFVGIRALSFLGNLSLLALSAAKNLMTFVAVSRTAALALFSMKAIALAIPVLIGAAVAALFLLIQDLVVYFQGGDSLIGSLIDNFDKAAPKFLEALDNFEASAVGKVKEVMQKISDFFTSDEFAPERQKIANALLTALDVAIVGSTALVKIGYKIGEAIVNGIIDVMADKAPGLFGVLGIKSERRRKQEFDFKKEQTDIANAQKFIQKYGVEDTSKVFSPDIIAKASARNKRLEARKVTPAEIKQNPEILKLLLDNPALARALQDGQVSVAEMIKDSSIIAPFKRYKQLTEGGQNNFNTNVTINGSGLDEKQLERAVSSGINKAQMQTVRDLQNQTQSAIAE